MHAASTAFAGAGALHAERARAVAHITLSGEVMRGQEGTEGWCSVDSDRVGLILRKRPPSVPTVPSKVVLPPKRST